MLIVIGQLLPFMISQTLAYTNIMKDGILNLKPMILKPLQKLAARFGT